VSPGLPAAKIRIVVADDHTLFREGIVEMLSGTDGVDGIEVVAEAADGDAARELAVQHRPDILLLDVEMPGAGAGAVTRAVSRACPQVKIIILSMHDDAEIVHHLIDCGAAAYLVKTVSRDELVTAIRSVVRRPDSVLLAFPRHTVESFAAGRRGTSAELLTRREAEILRLAAEALSNAHIGKRLCITEATVKRHLTNVYAKLNAVSRVDAIRKAADAKLINPYGEHSSLLP
jgi:DNA-binding NarL/FixJ family response regulator